jgi:hypothetical protein
MNIFAHVMRLVWLLALSALLLVACKRASSDQPAQDRTSPGETVPTLPETGSNLRLRSDSAATRGLPQDFDATRDVPRLYALVRDDAQMRSALERYAQRVVLQQGLNSESDLLALFQQREETIIPRLTPFFENQSDDILRQFDPYERELNLLGMSMTTAEGTITGLGPAPMLSDLIARVASPNFVAYQRFLTARTLSRSGEYPYMNLTPYEDMALAGETLMEQRPNPYWDKISEEFERALTAVTDLHVVSQSDTRPPEESPMVGGLHTAPYPYATDLSPLKNVAERHPGSSLAQAIQRIAQYPSQMSAKPETLYLIVLEWTQQEAAARQQVQSYLRAGEDIPHYLPVQRGDGTLQYAVTYRFYEDADRADAALTRIRKTHPEAKLIFCSVKGDKLYQLGPSAG